MKVTKQIEDECSKGGVHRIELDRVVQVLEDNRIPTEAEGLAGSYKLLIEGECPECGCNRLVETYDNMAWVGRIICPACDNIVDER